MMLTSDVVMIGRGILAQETAHDLSVRCRVVGAFSVPGEPDAEDFEVADLGPVTGLAAWLESHPVDEVYLAADTHRYHDALQDAVRTCETYGTPFAVPAHVFRFGRALPRDGRSVVDGYMHYSLVMPSPLQLKLKRLVDILMSGAALLALSPLFLVVAAAIKLTSPGPLFFGQVRVGRFGRTFRMWKFRSMVVDAEARLKALQTQNEQSGPVFKMTHDPRITAVGRFIRKHSIDELPQLFNVLRGEMSVVGPRPPVPAEVAQYKPWQRRRLSVVPGLTCFWQVMGRNQIGFEEWMMLDLRYVDQWSVARDVELIGRTFVEVLTGKGAS